MIVGGLVVLASIVVGCDGGGDDVSGSGLRLYFFEGGLGSEGVALSDVDLSAASLVIEDSDIEQYVWEEQRLVLPEALVDRIREQTGRRFDHLPFVLVFGEEPLTTGEAKSMMTAVLIVGPQIKAGSGGIWFAASRVYPDADALAGFGIDEATIEAIRSHFEATGRLR